MIVSTGSTVPSALATCVTAISFVRGPISRSKARQIELARIVDRRHFQHDALFVAQHLPRHDVGVVLHVGDEHLVARRQEGAAVALRHQVDRLGGAAHEHDLARRRAR